MEKEKLNKAIKELSKEIKVEEKNAKESDEVWGCCDKSLSDGIIAGMQVGLSYLKSLK